MRFVGRCYRAHDPFWSFDPLSGEGAAKTGGRFNRKGEATLYLSLDVVTSLGECTQGFTQRMAPLTMCEYDVDCANVADLRTAGSREALGVAWTELDCPWLTHLLAGTQSPSWEVADRLKTTGNYGVLVPSFVPGATESNVNLVLWSWGTSPPCRVNVYDPSGRLPKDQLSWS